MGSNWVLSIDFGTTNTAAAISDGERIELVEIDGAPRIPSVVLAADSGGLVVGAAAERQLALTPERAERTPKRRIGEATMLLGSRAVRPVDAVGAIFRAVAAEAVRRQGGVPPASLRLTHPARWGSVRLAVLAEAAEIAGLPAPSFVAEPVAAAVHFADERIVDGAHVAVYDLGGGTLDTAVLRRIGQGFEVIGAPGGDERLGGETFDERLWEHLGTRLSTTNAEAWEELRFGTERQWRKAGHDFRTEVRRAKEALSSNADYTIYLGAPVDAELLITRDEVENLIRADVERTVGELLATVDRAGLVVDDLAAVNLVGGSSRIPLITRLVAERTGRVPDTWGDPKAAVVLGAAKAAPDSIKTSGAGRRSKRPAPALAQIDGYEVLGELGRGGMGVVYLARQPSLGRLVAVKTLPSLDPSLTARLEREASVLAELQHPHIATVVDVGVQGAATFVVMPFFPGGTLAQVLDHSGPLSAGQTAGVLAAVAEALAATHGKGFLHRDVKPSNILLSGEGEPYLADFGLAFPMLDGSRMTSSRSVLGTVPYTAPEIIADDPPQAASDVYALGVTGYQLLTGRLPYAGSNVIAVIDAIRRGSASPLDVLAPDAPKALCELIAGAMAPDVASRPSNLRAFAADLRHAVNVEAVLPAPPAAWVALAATPSPSPSDDATGSVDTSKVDDGTSAPTAGSGAVADTVPRADRPDVVPLGPPPEPAPRNGARRKLIIAIAAVVMLIAGAATAMALTSDTDGDKERLAAAGSSTTTTPSTTTSTEPPTTSSTVTDTTAVQETVPTAAPVVKPVRASTTTTSSTTTPPVVRDPTPTDTAPPEPPPSTSETPSSGTPTAPSGSGSGSGSGTTTTSSTTQPPDTYPNTTERALLAHVPSSVKGDGSSCRRSVGNEVVPGANANIICGIYGADFVEYSSFPSSSSLNSWYAERQSWARGEYGSYMDGNCNGDYNSFYGDTNYSGTTGRLLCYIYGGGGVTQTSGTQWYEWRFDSTPIYAYLSGANSASAWEAWNSAGPNA
jgi:serine/threonine protein kinase/actin-like ATPase involved in cell morphogenesis